MPHRLAVVCLLLALFLGSGRAAEPPAPAPGLGQTLFLDVESRLDRLRQRIGQAAEDNLEVALRDLRQEIEDTLEQAGGLVRGLRPRVADDDGQMAARNALQEIDSARATLRDVASLTRAQAVQAVADVGVAMAELRQATQQAEARPQRTP